MKEEEKKSFQMSNPANQRGEIGIRTDIDPAHPENTIDRYPGDSVDEHKELEEANEHFADEEIEQVNNNS